MVVGSISASRPGRVLQEGLLVVVEARGLVVRDVARLPRRGQRQLGLLLLRVEREIRAHTIENLIYVSNCYYPAGNL